MAGLDFRNPAGPHNFACFKKIYVIKRNMNENPGKNLDSNDNQVVSSKKTIKSNYQIQIQNEEIPDQEECIHTVKNTDPTPWNPSELNFPCPLGNHKHEVSSCTEFFNLTPLDRWDKIKKMDVLFLPGREENA